MSGSGQEYGVYVRCKEVAAQGCVNLPEQEPLYLQIFIPLAYARDTGMKPKMILN